MPEIVSASGQSLGATPGAFMRPPQPHQHRMGLVAARIGSTFAHRLGVDAGYARAGQVVHMDVQDATRHPEEAAAAKWVCSARSQVSGAPIACPCSGRVFESKAALYEAHLPNQDLVKQHEVHLYYAVYERAATPAQAKHRDKTGAVVEAAPERPAAVMLLSDEA